MGSLQEAGEERVGGGIAKGMGARRNRKNVCNIAQYFTIGKAHGGRKQYGKGREPGVHGRGSGKFRPPPPLPLPG